MNIKHDPHPWGTEEWLTENEASTVKILTVDAGKRCSLQYHHHRKEFWKVIEGELNIIIGERNIDAKLGDEFMIEAETKHRLIGTGKPAKILEISFGQFDENDIVRLEDDYGRK